MQKDYAVIGGGHNGLIAANYLAKAGYSVVVIEQQPYLGGMAASYPHVASAPHHVLSQGAIDSVFIKTTTIIEDLALSKHGLSLIDIDPGYGWVGEDGDTLCVFQDALRTARDIERYSKADARNYLDLQHAFARILKIQLPLFGKAAASIGPLDLVKAALRVIGDRGTRQALSRLVMSTAHEAISMSFESDPLRSLYAYWCEIAGPADIDGSGLNLASLALIHQVGCSRPVGSMGGLITALQHRFESRGGSVLLNAAVEQIIVERGHASGVRLKDGCEIRATRGVLASCAPQITYGRLLDRELQSANSRARLPFMPANGGNMCPFKVDMALAGRLSFSNAQEQRNRLDGADIGAASLMTGSFDDHLAHSAALRSGQMGHRPPIWMTVLSHADRSIAPQEGDVAYLYTSVPYQAQAQAPRIADELVAAAAQHLNGLETEIGRCITAPADFERQYSTPRACLYHVDMLPTRMMGSRPAVGMGGCHSEIAGLYLAGSGSHPGGGVFGMPGKLAAEAALSKAR